MSRYAWKEDVYYDVKTGKVVGRIVRPLGDLPQALAGRDRLGEFIGADYARAAVEEAVAAATTVSGGGGTKD